MRLISGGRSAQEQGRGEVGPVFDFLATEVDIWLIVGQTTGPLLEDRAKKFLKLTSPFFFCLSALSPFLCLKTTITNTGIDSTR